MPRFALVLLLLILGVVAVQQRPTTASAAQLEIAILQVADFVDWDDGDFAALGEAPGISSFEWELIGVDELTPVGLAGFNVLIIPGIQDNSWKTDANSDAIADFVAAGGTLIVYYTRSEGSGPEPLFDAFGANYAIDWAPVDGELVTITNPGHPLVSFPNTLTEEGLSNWQPSYHSSAESFGAAWTWAASGSGFEGGEQDDGPILGCAPFGQGAIVIHAVDANWHNTEVDVPHPEAWLAIENALVACNEPSSPGIDIDNANDNALNNDNLNDNNNVNTNTQVQSNEQIQENDNNQTTTVNSSPSVVIRGEN